MRLAMPENQVAGFWDQEGSPAQVHLNADELAERDFDLFWNGRIEGYVRDDFGEPARASVKLTSAEGEELARQREFLPADQTGWLLSNKEDFPPAGISSRSIPTVHTTIGLTTSSIIVPLWRRTMLKFWHLMRGNT